MQWSTRKKIVTTVFLSLVFLAVYGWWLYVKPPESLQSVPPAAEITAVELVRKYMNDEAGANALYLGKTIQVSGIITAIHHHDSLANLMLGEPGGLHQVSCVMDQHYNAHGNPLVAGQAVVIKGVCTGLLMDVELNRCIVAALIK